MDALDIIDAKLNEIDIKIKCEKHKIKLTRKQCAQMSKYLTNKRQ